MRVWSRPVVSLSLLSIGCQPPGQAEGGASGVTLTVGDGDGDSDSDGSEGDASDGEASADGPDLDMATGPGPGGTADPTTCAEAAMSPSYVGCEFWPTVTYNPVLDNFDFAAVVANGGAAPAAIIVERDGATVTEVEIPPGDLQAIVLPWVPALKGPQFSADTTGARPKNSVRLDGGAYRLTSSVPVTAWQFSPLQYTDAVSDCAIVQDIGLGASCLSVSNDAALLIPTTALTPNYRVFIKGSVKGSEGGFDDTPSVVAITATQDATTVTVSLTDTAGIVDGAGVPTIPAGGVHEFAMDAGDVVQLMGQPGTWWGDAHGDLSGMLVNADAPVQVIGAVPLTSVPSPEVAGQGYADHLEETILPAEALGEHYVVAPPTSSQGENIGHFLRFYGNFDGTQLSYPGGKPSPSAPDQLDAGDVVELETDEAFEVIGTASFAIGMFMRGGQVHTPGAAPTVGDPAFSLAVAVPQFRSRYSFLAPTDYLASYADILLPAGASAALDDAPLSSSPEPIAGTSWVLHRELLGPGVNGVHVLQTQMGPDQDHAPPAGLQVMGYGHATGYMVPGGLNLEIISEPPLIP